MKPKRQRKSVALNYDESKYDEMCQSEFYAEDAAVISKHFRKRAGPRNPPRKTLQLCRQVAETLNAVLSGECRDSLLQTLFVESVIPAPDVAQVLVTVHPLDRMSGATEAEILERLQFASGWLRTEVAAAITRKRAPLLIFQVKPSALEIKVSR